MDRKKEAEPKFILWVPERQVFQQAEVKMPSQRDDNWMELSYDFSKNTHLSGKDISLSSLELLASVYLGEDKIFDTIEEKHLDYVAFQRKREFYNKLACGIVKTADGLARDHKVPYFSVVLSKVDLRKWNFLESGWSCHIEEHKEYPIGFSIHPTVQLYTSRTTDSNSSAL